MHYGDELTIETRVAALSERAMTLEFTFTNEDDTVTAEKSLTAAFYDIESQRGTTIPDDMREKLGSIRVGSPGVRKAVLAVYRFTSPVIR